MKTGLRLLRIDFNSGLRSCSRKVASSVLLPALCGPFMPISICSFGHLEGWFPGHVVEVYALSGGGLFVNRMISSCVFLSIFKVHMFFLRSGVAFLKISQFHWYTNTSPQIFSSFMHLVVDPPPDNFHCTVLYNNNRGACLRVGRIWAFRA